MEKYRIDFFDIVIIGSNKLCVYKQVPLEVKIEEPRFPGDDRERIVAKSKEELFLAITIPEQLIEKVKDNEHKLNHSNIELEFEIINNENILKSIPAFDLDDFDTFG
jgi:hypothetical protein